MFGEEFLIAAAIASAMASVGGTVANMSAQSSIRKKQATAQAAEAARQHDIDQRRAAEINKATPQFTPQVQEQKQKSLADQLTQYMTPTTNTATEYLADGSTPQEVRDSMSRQLVGALQQGKDYAQNMAQVSSLGRLNLDNKIGLNRLGENVGLLNSESARSTGILPMELDDANLAGVPGYTAGAALNGIGSIADAVAKANIVHRGGLDGLFGSSPKALAKGSPLPLNSNIA